MLTRKQSRSLEGVGPPPRKRGLCTDFPCFLTLLAGWAAFGYILHVASQPPSDYRRVLHGIDSSHDVCGMDNSVAATGRPLVEEHTINRPSVFAWLWPFASYPEPRMVTIRRAGRDHTSRPLLYFTFPSATLGGHPSVAVCVSECPLPPRPSEAAAAAEAATAAAAAAAASTATGANLTTNATSNATMAPLEDPSRYVCTGQYYGTPSDRCSALVSDGGAGSHHSSSSSSNSSGGHEGRACTPPPSSQLFSAVGREVLDACDDPMRTCDVCYPPYRTVALASYCLPDPQHALETFSTIVTAFGAIGASLDGRMTFEELDEMRRFVSSAPHILWEDLVASAPVVYACIGSAFVYGLLWMLLIRMFAHLMVWATATSISAGCAVGAYYMWLTQSRMRASPRFTSGDRLFVQQADYLYWGFFLVAMLGSAYTIALVVLHRKLILAVKVMKEASRAVTGVPSVLLLPIATLCLSAAIFCGWGITAVLLISTGELEPRTPGFGHIFLPIETWGWLALLGLTGVWTLCFIRHVQHCAVAGALSSWYFADGERWHGLGIGLVVGTLGRVLGRHTGSVAAGSLLITLLQAVRIFVIVVMKRLKACAGDSSVARLACCCVQCCLGCVERCVRYISRNAYVVMMVKGTSFCGAATEALSLLTKHMMKVAVLRSVGWSFLVLGKLFVTGAAAGTGALVLLTQPPWSDELFSIFPAVLAISLGAWFVGSAFMGVYNMAIDTVFLCYTIDLERARVAGELEQAAGHRSKAASGKQAPLHRLCDEAEAEAEAEERKAAFEAATQGQQGGLRRWLRAPFGRPASPPQRGSAAGASAAGAAYPEVATVSCGGGGLAEGNDAPPVRVAEGIPVHAMSSSTRGHHIEMPTSRWDGGRV